VAVNLVVTGSGSGIGRALSEHLLGRGDAVWGLARSDQSEFAARHPGLFRFRRCDLSKWPQAASAADEIGAAWSHIDGLVCCAGIQGAIGPASTVEPSRWSETVRGNLDATFFAIRAFRALLSRSPRRAKIVCFSGGGATKPRPNFSAYAAAKAAIARLVETIAAEEGPSVDINAVAPGAVPTRMTEEILAGGPAAGAAEVEAARKAKDAGGAPMARAIGLVEWLLSPSSDGISGRLLSAQWDPWPDLARRKDELASSDVYTLRRVVPEDRAKSWI
jgi:3-oxoacyl-[acyl-carrier protein] reductase